MPDIKTLLIIANSGRLLAQMSRNAGYGVIVIDCFADVDTQSFAKHCTKIESLSLDALKTAFNFIPSQYKPDAVIIGSGFECHIDSLKYIHQQITVLGNTTETFLSLQNKKKLFQTLKQYKIPHPKTSFQPPKQTINWLAKPIAGEGGLGIENYSQSLSKNHTYYWQKFIQGIPMSVLFISNASGHQICGYHKQYTSTIGKQPFIFSGIISYTDLAESIKKQLTLYIEKLIHHFNLKGLNSLDFILKNKQCYVLEINPRPSASMQLYDDDLITQHINSCLDKLFKTQNTPTSYCKAYQIIFAKKDTLIKESIQWPEGVVDIPQSGSFVYTNQPICSIIAKGKSEHSVLKQLQLKQRTVINLLQ